MVYALVSKTNPFWVGGSSPPVGIRASMNVQYTLQKIWEYLEKRFYDYFARVFGPWIRVFVRHRPLIEAYLKIGLSIIKWLTIGIFVSWLFWCAYVAWPLLVRAYAEFSMEGITAERLIPWLYKVLMWESYICWLIPTVLFSPYITYRVVWEVCLWLAEEEDEIESENGEEQYVRPYERTDTELFIEMTFGDLSIFLLFWIQQQVYVAYLYDLLVKPLVLEGLKLRPMFANPYQTWGSWTDYNRFFALFDWWERLNSATSRLEYIQRGIQTSGTFYHYEPFWNHGTVSAVPSRSYQNVNLAKHWMPDDYWLTLCCRRVLFARQVSPHGGAFLKPHELQVLDWGCEIYTPTSVSRSWRPLWGFHLQDALYFGYASKNFSIPTVLEGHSYFRAVCLSKGININYGEWLPDLFIKKSVIDNNSRLYLWYFHAKNMQARHQYNLDHDVFTLAWLWSQPCRIHQNYHYMPDYYAYYVYRDVFNGAEVISPARLIHDSYGDALFLCMG